VAYFRRPLRRVTQREWNVFIAALAPVQNVMLGSRIGGLPPYILYGVPALLGGLLLFFILRRK
jgi:hypothetical protein